MTLIQIDSWRELRGTRIKTIVLVRCFCGKEFSTLRESIRSGNTKSCGCRKNLPRPRHGLYKSPTYISWAAMIQRCTNPKNKCFHLYGGKGIEVCDRWRDFALFVEDMGEKLSREYVIDRIDSSKNYEPGNCRWITKSQNSVEANKVRWNIE